MIWLTWNIVTLSSIYIGLHDCKDIHLNKSTTSLPFLATCPPGTTPLTCGTNCISNCKGTGCVSGNSVVECLDECRDGYSGRACNIPCFHDCLKCDRGRRENCIRCADGLYGTRCDETCPSECGLEGCYDNAVCRKACLLEDVCGNNCLPNCKNCNNTLKICESCKLNYAGDYCDISCRICYPDGNCARSGCLGCRKGFYGTACTACPDNCHSHCIPTEHCEQTCDQISGHCLSGCKDGYWGLRCKNTCDSKCKDSRCNQSSGICESCAEGYHGENCRMTCTGCKNDICDRVTGKCFECIEGFYGIECTSHCVSCPSGICQRLNGNCATVPTPVHNKNSTESSPEASGLSQLSIAFFSFGILSAVVVSILLYKLCRKSSGKSPVNMVDSSAVYISNGYEEINEEDMDPSGEGCAVLIHSGNSTDTNPEEELGGTAVNCPNPKRPSSDDDSLIIPEWFGQTEESPSFIQNYIKYLSPVDGTADMMPDSSL